MSKPHIRCSKCGRRLRNPDRSEGWRVVAEDGLPPIHTCPECRLIEITTDTALSDAGDVSAVADCVACTQSTDTAIWLAGSRRYVASVIEELGVDSVTAAAMAGDDVIYRIPLCSDCATALNTRYRGDLVVCRDDNVVIRPEPGSRWEDPQEIGKLLEPGRC